MKQYVLFLMLILLVSNVSAIGVSPPRIILEDLPKGEMMEKSVTISGIEKNSIIKVSLSGEGSEWVESKKGSEFLVEENEDLDLPFIISIPQKAPNGEYEVSAQIVVSPEEKGNGPNSATVSPGILVNIKFTVSGKEVKSYRITNIQIPNLETGNPVFVVMNVDNGGNVLVKPKKVDLVIKDKERNVITSISSKKITSVEPYTTGKSVARFDFGLEPEFYFADVKIHKEKRTEEIKDIPFDVVNRGAFKANGELTKLEVQENVEEIAKIDAFFTNKGDIDLYSTLKGEVYKENTLIEFFESDPEYVEKGEEKKFTYYYEVPEIGEYEVKGYVEFLGKTTNTKEVVFRASKSVSKIKDYSIPLLAVGIVGAVFFMRRKKK